MRTRPKYLIAALGGMMIILVACAAGCTSSNISPRTQASAASSAGQSDKFTNQSDSPGFDQTRRSYHGTSRQSGPLVPKRTLRDGSMRPRIPFLT
ncbi:MAG: hypothetical protein WCI87_07250 [Euryarchaeota archaeon]